MSEDKASIEVEEPIEGHVEEEEVPEWTYPFSEQDVAIWKEKYGKTNVHLVIVEDEFYVVRGLFRNEFKELSELDFRNEEHMEDVFVKDAVLYPELSELDIRNLPGGVSSNLFETIMEKTNMEAWKDKEILKLALSKEDMEQTAQDLIQSSMDSGELTFDDIKGIYANPKNHKRIYVTEFEGQTFLYKGLTRSEFERLRGEQRDGKYQGPASEEELCQRCVIFPYKFKASGDDWLHGTITSLSLMIMRISGFGSTKEVVTL